MLDLFNTPSSTKADVQYFYEDGVWVKPRGASHVYMMLIGGGGNGNGTSGGGAGNVVIWFGNASTVPDNLVIHPSTGNADNTTISYSGASLSTLLTANAASLNAAGAAASNTHFGAQGFFESTAGVNGFSGAPSSSNSNFLGPSGASGTASVAYGYVADTTSESYFITQPIIIGCGIGSASVKNGAIGCGGSSNASSLGGSGLVIIGSW